VTASSERPRVVSRARSSTSQTGRTPTVRAMVEAVVAAAEFRGRVQYVSVSEAERTMGAMAEALALGLALYAARAGRILGWRPWHLGFLSDVGTHLAAWQAAKDLGTDTILVFNGLLRSRLSAGELFRKFIVGLAEGIENRQAFPSTARCSNGTSWPWAIEGVLVTDYPSILARLRDARFAEDVGSIVQPELRHRYSRRRLAHQDPQRRARTRHYRHLLCLKAVSG
jgi:hypothetical protein